MKRALVSKDATRPTFTPKAFMPVAFQAWDGGAGETGAKMSLTSWYYLRLEEPQSSRRFVVPPVVAILTFGRCCSWFASRTDARNLAEDGSASRAAAAEARRRAPRGESENPVVRAEASGRRKGVRAMRRALGVVLAAALVAGVALFVQRPDPVDAQGGGTVEVTVR